MADGGMPQQDGMLLDQRQQTIPGIPPLQPRLQILGEDLEVLHIDKWLIRFKEASKLQTEVLTLNITFHQEIAGRALSGGVLQILQRLMPMEKLHIFIKWAVLQAPDFLCKGNRLPLLI